MLAMLIKWSDLIVIKDAPVAVQVHGEDVWLIEPDEDEEEAFISTMRKIVELGEDVEEEEYFGWMRVPLEKFTPEEKKILKELMEVGLVKLEGGERL